MGAYPLTSTADGGQALLAAAAGAAADTRCVEECKSN